MSADNDLSNWKKYKQQQVVTCHGVFGGNELGITWYALTVDSYCLQASLLWAKFIVWCFTFHLTLIFFVCCTIIVIINITQHQKKKKKQQQKNTHTHTHFDLCLRAFLESIKQHQQQHSNDYKKTF